MTTHPTLQPRDYETGYRLTHCHRITTAAIEARHLGVSETTARKRLNRLRDGKLLCRLTAWCSEVAPINAPLFQWTPGDAEPDFGAIAYEAQERWRHNPVRKTVVYTASKKLLALFALPPRPHVKLLQATHDLGVTEAFFYCQREFPHLEFIAEDLFGPLRGHGEGVEDAQLIDGDNVVAVVEHAGAYRKDRVAHFHNHVSERTLPYLLF